MTLTALIEALEKAEGPSEKLDLEIWRLTRATSFAPDAQELGVWHNGASRYVSFHTGFTKKERREKNCDSLLRYTSSIDAALTLIPEGALWDVEYKINVGPLFVVPDGEPEKKYSAHLFVGAPPSTEIDGHHFTSAPMALCIAALRARDK